MRNRTLATVDTSSSPKKQKHVLTEEHIEPINQWWEKDNTVADARQWVYLEHKGIIFTRPYEPHGKPLVVFGKEFILPPEAEEVATFWCNAAESDYGTKERFVKNFWGDFLGSFPTSHPVLTGEGLQAKPTFDDCDFSRILSYLKAKKEEEAARRKALSAEEKRQETAARQEVEGPNSTCLFDGLREKVGSYKAEPPSLFRGRGAHPKMGKVKR